MSHTNESDLRCDRLVLMPARPAAKYRHPEKALRPPAGVRVPAAAPGLASFAASLGPRPGGTWGVRGPVLAGRVFKILVIDDQSSGRLIVSEILRGVAPSAEVTALGDPLEAIEYCGRNPLDLVLTDYRMPGIDGVEVIRRLRAIPHMAEVPIICVTVVDDREVKYRALEVGATDFLQRPLDPFECAARCKNLLALRSHQIERLKYTHELERSINAVTAELDMRKMETLHRLAKVAEQRDSDTALHLVRMAKYSVILARKCGWNENELRLLEIAAPLHDIGKIGIPDAILQAKRRLTDEEMDVMRKHSSIGFDMLHGSESPPLQLAAEIAHSHHEKFDGTGYPRALKGEQISLEARIVAIADVYDALTSSRPYKRAWSVEETAAYLREQRAKHFDPELLDMFLASAEEIEEVRITYRDLPRSAG